MSRVPRIAAFVGVLLLPVGAGVAVALAADPDPPRVPPAVRIGESPAAPLPSSAGAPGRLPPPAPKTDDDDDPFDDLFDD
ncbi:hypothetical protein [Amycolatopsis silviterrae]|uniref:Small hydrophilic protein n=1 Tax=Amycolatopsis silviterrae TaxID=1656914 RepID=A0ABW5HGC9_9PSEU